MTIDYILKAQFSAQIEEVQVYADDPNAPRGSAQIFKALNKSPDTYTSVRISVNGEPYMTLSIEKARELRDVLNRLNLDER